LTFIVYNFQLNQATNKLDLSQLYGYDEDDQNKLRLNIQGLLKTSTDDTALLPKITSNDLCYNLDNKTSCYFSGDTRVNSNPTVTVLYTLFLRSHNQIAQKLKRMNPKWSDEELFAVTKDINVAIYQKFIYNDWANAVLGKRLALDIRNKNDDAKKYKSDKVSNEFGTVAIRFYNSMQPGDLFEIPTHARSHSKSTENLVDSGRMKEIMKLQDTFFQPKDLSRGNFFDQLVSTVLRQKAMAMDTSYVDDLAIQLYRSKMHDSQIFGTDSLALDIQRARDHGIQSYTNYIKKCLNIRINQWSDLRNIIREDDLHRLRSIYESVFDVDLIVGGLSEIPKENATVGPTFACILSKI
jgi:peroxidase